MTERNERPEPRDRRKLIALNAVLLVLAWGVAVIAGMRSNVQGTLEIAAYGTIILFFGAIIVQLLIVMALERAVRKRGRGRHGAGPTPR